MPGYFDKLQGRRDFVKLSTAAAGAQLLAPTFAWAQSPDESPAAQPAEQFHVALLSDPHIPENAGDGWNGFSPIDQFKKVAPRVLAAQPAAAIISGDVARLVGTVGDYRVLKKLLAPLAEAMPIFLALGNHDHRENFYKVFPDEAKRPEKQSLRNKHVTILESPVVRLIVLDSLYHVNEGAGLLGKAQRTWLADYLDQADKRPTSLVVHHTLGDSDGDLLDSDRLFAMLQKRTQVKAIFFGHSHVYHVDQRDKIHLINLPAIGYNFSDQQPLGWVDAHFGTDGVRFKLDAVSGNLKRHGEQVDLTWLR